MALKFNPFTGTLDYTVSAIASLLKAKKPLKITGEEIEIEKEGIIQEFIGKEAVGPNQIGKESVTLAKMAENSVGTAQLVNKAVTETKVELPEYIVKTAAQSITGGKTFEGEVLISKALGSSGKVNLMKGSLTTTLEGTAPIMRLINTEGTIQISTKPGAGAGNMQLFRNGVVIEATANSEPGPTSTIKSVPRLQAALAISPTKTWHPICVDSGPELGPLAGGTAEGNVSAVRHKIEKFEAGWTIAVNRGVLMQDSAAVGGTLTAQRALDVEDLKAGTNNYSVYSIGTAVKLLNEGPAEFGGLVTAKKGLKVEGAASELTLPAESVTEAALKNEAVSEAKLKGEAVSTGKIAAEAVTFPKMAPFSFDSPIEIAAGKTYEVPSNIQGLWKESISVQGTLNVQGRFDEVGIPEPLWYGETGVPTEVPAGKIYDIPAINSALWRDNMSVQGTINVQGRLTEV